MVVRGAHEAGTPVLVACPRHGRLTDSGSNMPAPEPVGARSRWTREVRRPTTFGGITASGDGPRDELPEGEMPAACKLDGSHRTGGAGVWKGTACRLRFLWMDR